jgi:hypothetical protein
VTAVDIVDRLEQCLPALSGALEQKRLGNALEQALKAAAKLEYQSAKFHALVRTAEILHEFMPGGAAISEVISEIEDLGRSMHEASDSSSLSSLAREIPDVEKTIVRFHREVLTMLDRYTARHISPLIALGRLLDRIEAGSLGQKLKTLENDATLVKNGLPTELPNRVTALDSKRIELLGELKALANDPEVDAFLRALGYGRTSLTLVTPKVLKWLIDQGATDKFFIVQA